MARKKRKGTPPKVIRSSFKPKSQIQDVTATPTPSASTSSSVGRAAVASASRAPVEETYGLEKQYAHVKKDLVRITIFGTLIFAVMFALKFVGI